MPSSSFIIIPSFFLLTILVYLILKLTVNNPSHKKTVDLNNYLKGTISTLKSEGKDNTLNKESFDFEDYSRKVKEIIDVADHFQKNSLQERIAICRQSPKLLILRAKVIWIVEVYLILMAYFIFPTLSISLFLGIVILRSFLFLSTSSLVILLLSVIIILRFSRPQRGLMYKALTVRKPSIFSKLKKIKGYVKILEPKTSNATYYEPELNSKFYIVKIVIKILIFGLVLVALYLFLNSILKLQSLDKQSVLELIRSSFLLFALFGFIICTIKFKMSKFENFSLFFLFISLYELSQIELNWKFTPNLLAFIISITLLILSTTSYLKNRKTRDRSSFLLHKGRILLFFDYIKKNIYNLTPLLFLLIDLEIFSRFIFALELPNLSAIFLNFQNTDVILYELLYTAIYIILFLLSLKSIINFLKFYSFLISGTFRPRIRTIVYRMIVLLTYFVLIPHVSSVIGLQAYLLLFSSNLFQFIVYLSLRLFKRQQIEKSLQSQNLNRISVRKIKNEKENLELQEFVKSKVKKSESNNLVYKKDYYLAPQQILKSFLTEEKAKEEKIGDTKKKLEEILKSLNYIIIPRNSWINDTCSAKFLDVDFLALKINEVSHNLRLLVVFPIIISDLNGKFIVSKNKTYYEPLQQDYKIEDKNKKLVINFETQQSILNQNAILRSLREKGVLFDLINRKVNLSLDVHETRTNIIKFNTYFQAGPVNVKLIVTNILVSHMKPGFFNQNIPFPYQKYSNTYFSELNKFTSLVKYLEDKYTIIESVVEDNILSELEQRAKEKYDKNVKILRYPLIFQIICTIVTWILFFSIPNSKDPSYSYFFYIFAFTVPPISAIFLITYLNYLKKKISVVIESLTPYYKRYLKTDERNYNYMLDLQPKELTKQFIHEQVK